MPSIRDEWFNRPAHLMHLSLAEYVADKDSKKDTPVAPPVQVTPPKSDGGPRHVWGKMNKLEGNYANHLELRKITGEILNWRFETVRFRLAPKTTYTPDFQVIFPDGLIEFHETKGFWRQAGRIKIKIASSMFTEFKFIAVQWDKKAKGWKFEEFR